jgi:hypothetical protein
MDPKMSKKELTSLTVVMILSKELYLLMSFKKVGEDIFQQKRIKLKF